MNVYSVNLLLCLQMNVLFYLFRCDFGRLLAMHCWERVSCLGYLKISAVQGIVSFETFSWDCTRSSLPLKWGRGLTPNVPEMGRARGPVTCDTWTHCWNYNRAKRSVRGTGFDVRTRLTFGPAVITATWAPEFSSDFMRLRVFTATQMHWLWTPRDNSLITLFPRRTKLQR